MERPASTFDNANFNAANALPRWDFSQSGMYGNSPAVIQRKLIHGDPADAHEQEANRIASLAASRSAPPIDGASGHDDSPAPGQRAFVQTKYLSTSDSARRDGMPPVVNEVLRAPGQSLDLATRALMEPRFGHDFSRVRIHTDERAAQASRSIGARAFTAGHQIVFGSRQYAPGTDQGRSLIAHELTHTVQQASSGRTTAPGRLQCYTEAERREMAEGKVKGQADDVAMAQARGFVPGDIVFRLGSTALGIVTGEEVTHGGIYVGDGLIHDVVGFGNRHVRVTNFFNPKLGEAAKTSTYRTVRFVGPHADLILARLLSNIAKRDFNMPTDPVPFNLFSSAGDYKTATCLEYAHAQFLYAIRQLALDPSISEGVRASLRQTYFTGASDQPNALIKPTEQTLAGNMAEPTISSGGGFGAPPPRTPSALIAERGLIAAASAMASDVDPKKFQNRSESQYKQHWPGGTIANLIFGMTYDEVVLNTFTYKSFIDSRQFFKLVGSAD
ncbi:DUF4157 domain-containing protein [Paraburkholderia pallida]|uniref:eCIS core domain-containing protein n=1 Tax=Paraburkholderia pallida TaxID=2547399 RepID=UPI0018D7A783|nr:DUF4157 domain-containing protein [Paraburkholderia pallida]